MIFIKISNNGNLTLSRAVHDHNDDENATVDAIAAIIKEQGQTIKLLRCRVDFDSEAKSSILKIIKKRENEVELAV